MLLNPIELHQWELKYWKKLTTASKYKIKRNHLNKLSKDLKPNPMQTSKSKKSLLTANLLSNTLFQKRT